MVDKWQQQLQQASSRLQPTQEAAQPTPQAAEPAPQPEISAKDAAENTALLEEIEAKLPEWGDRIESLRSDLDKLDGPAL